MKDGIFGGGVAITSLSANVAPWNEYIQMPLLSESVFSPSREQQLVDRAEHRSQACAEVRIQENESVCE